MRTPRDDGDYQHDEAHDLVHGRVPSPASSHRGSVVTPALPPVLEDGDYAYDHAHDFGRGSGRD